MSSDSHSTVANSVGEATTVVRPAKSRWNFLRVLDQGYLVAIVTVALALVFAISLNGFATFSNIQNIGRESAVLGILSLCMAVVVIGRGIDLSVVATWGFTPAISATYINAGHSATSGLLVGLGVAIAFGLINGVLVAYVEIPPLFVTLATSLLFVGGSQLLYVKNRMGNLEGAQFVVDISRSQFFGVPTPVIILSCLAILIHTFMNHTGVGLTIYASGDKPAAAVLTGLPVRAATLFTYIVSATLAYLAGLISIGVAGLYDITIASAGTKLYDVFAVVVVGGVSLAGGRGKINGIIAGTVFIGVIVNGLVLMRLSNIEQNGLKALIILIALVIESVLHPPDEETARPGEL